MPTATAINDLAARKLLLVRQAEIYREILTLERLNMKASIVNSGTQLLSHRWWLIGGLACASWMFSSKLSGIARWVPVVLKAAQFARRLRS